LHERESLLAASKPSEPDLLASADMSDRVRQILVEAAALFAERGYERTSMRDLADRCGISKALLYHHFADKEALYAHIALGFTRELTSAGTNPASGWMRCRLRTCITG
jgi:AcrR family transcriptional regulator